MGSGVTYDIVSKTPGEDKTLGTFVVKSGVGTGNTLGDVVSNSGASCTQFGTDGEGCDYRDSGTMLRTIWGLPFPFKLMETPSL